MRSHDVRVGAGGVDSVMSNCAFNDVGTAKGLMNASEKRTVQVSGAFGIPSNATAVYLNITSVNASAWGWLAVWPTGLPMPNSSNVNFAGGSVVPNMAIVKLGTDGTLQVYNDAGVSGAG